MNEWGEVRQCASEESSSTRARRHPALARLVPGLIVGSLFWLIGRPFLGAIVVVLSAALAAASSHSERVRGTVDRIMAKVAHGAGVVLTTALMLLVEIIVIAPIAVLAWVFRRDPLKPAGHRRLAGRWSAREQVATGSTTNRGFARERPPEGSVGRNWVVWLLPRIAGGLAVLVALDLGVGWVWDTVDGNRQADASESAVLGDRAAARGLPWLSDYLDELEALKYEFVPFVNSEPHDVSGRYVNIVEGVRRSYEVPSADAAPVVWFFGGSTVWGEGQRDEHTIPSAFARVAQAEGIVVRVVNRAQRGDVNFAEVQRLEQALAGNEIRPDLVVFADGPDDVAVQLEQASPQPSQYGLIDAQQDVHQDQRSWWERYRDHSVINRAADDLRGLFAWQPAAADPPPEESTVPALVSGIYARGIALADEIAAEHSVPVRYSWLPTEASSDARSQYSAATRELPDHVIDLSQVLDEPPSPVWLDEIHINEAGARLIAEALFESLRPDLERLVDQRGGAR